MERVVYTVGDIQDMLGCGRNKVYDLIIEAYNTQNMFRVIKIGKNYLIPKESFHNWLNGTSDS